MSIKGQGHSLTLIKGHSDFKVKCLTFGLYTQVSESGPLGPLVFNSVALRTAKTPKCFGLSECSRVNLEKAKYMYVNAPMSRHVVIKYWDMGQQYKQVL